jgi:hypothetical protein
MVSTAGSVIAAAILAVAVGAQPSGGASSGALSAIESGPAFTDTLRVPAHVIVPSDSLLLGAPFDVGVIWLTPEPVSNLILLTPPEALEPLEFIDVERGLDRGDTMTARVRVRAFDLGWIAVPALTWAGITADDVLVLAETSPDSVIVASIVPEGAEGLLDLHGAFPMEGRRPWWWWALGGLAVVLLGFALWWWRSHRKRDLPLAHADVPSHEAALAALAKLREDPRGRSGPWKPFYTDLTDTLRHYAWRRFGVPAPDYTTQETMRELSTIGLEQDGLGHGTLDELKQVLDVADAIKFAKAEPTAVSAGEDIERAIRFVTATVPPPPVDEDADSTVQTGSRTRGATG